MSSESCSESPICERIYALYRGEELLGVGTTKELAKARGVKPETIHFYSMPSYRKRFKSDSRRLVAVRL